MRDRVDDGMGAGLPVGDMTAIFGSPGRGKSMLTSAMRTWTMRGWAERILQAERDAEQAERDADRAEREAEAAERHVRELKAAVRELVAHVAPDVGA